MTPSVAEEEDQWIRCFQGIPESEVRLCCFPHAGGSASYYFPFAAGLAPQIEMLAVQYPGRQDRRLENFIDRIPDLADNICDALKSWIGPPLALFGHSMGAIIAFEVARRLQQRAGASPIWLFASGRRAPSRRRIGENVHLLDDAGILAELSSVGATDQRVLGDEELRAMILPVARNDYKAIETYYCAPSSQIGCPITALIGDSDSQVTVAEATAWGEHSTEGFDLRVLPGGHFYLDASRAAVIAAISGTLKKVCRPHQFEAKVP